MPLYGTRDASFVGKKATNATWIMQVDSISGLPEGTVLSSSGYNLFATTKETSFSPSFNEWEEMDDSGQLYASGEDLNTWTIESTFLESDSSIRNFANTFADHTFRIVYLGRKFDYSGTAKYEIHVFPIVRFKKTFSYPYGGNGQITFTAVTKPLAVDLASMPLPNDSFWLPTASSLTDTISASYQHYTIDIA